MRGPLATSNGLSKSAALAPVSPGYAIPLWVMVATPIGEGSA